MPKMHKNPVKFRFIIAAKKCVSKTLAKRLTKILQLVQKSHINYCKKVKDYTGVNRMWITESTKDILDDIEQVNKRKCGHSIQTFDFSTLYTKIDLDDLKRVLIAMLDKAFCGGQCKYIKISNNKAEFNNGKKGGIVYTKEDCQMIIRYVIDNAYFSFGNKVYQQVIGIPMGTDPAPYMANLYLHYYEEKWMNNLAKTDNRKARRNYKHTRRFIDDLGTLNNNNEIKDNWQKIYPKELVLNKENDSDNRATFLDLDMAVKNGKIVTKVYDKRDQFHFKIVSYPDLEGNIPEKSAYGVCTGQLIRIARNTTEKDDFINRVRTLMKKLIAKKYASNKLSKVMKKSIHRHDFISSKYDTSMEELIKLCLFHQN